MVTHTAKKGLLLSSLSRSQMKNIQHLRLRSERERTGLFYVEGMRFVDRAIHHHARIVQLIVCPELLTHSYARKLAREQKRAGVPVFEVSRAVMENLGQVQDSQGIGAIVRQRWMHLDALRPKEDLCWMAVETIRSPGNLGTMLRTSDAVGGAGLIVIDHAADPYDPVTVRATMGALFSQRFVHTTREELLHWKRRQQFLLAGTSPQASIDYQSVTYKSPTILLIGDERKGLPADLQALCDVMVSIPMVGESDSLNIAMATSVMLYELFNQQRKQT